MFRLNEQLLVWPNDWSAPGILNDNLAAVKSSMDPSVAMDEASSDYANINDLTLSRSQEMVINPYSLMRTRSSHSVLPAAGNKTLIYNNPVYITLDTVQ